MKTITISKLINRKWLTAELQTAGVRVDSVGQISELEAYADIHEDDEALALTIIEAHDLAQIEATEAAILAAPVSAREWFDSHANAKLLFSLSINDLETEIFTLVDTSFPLLLPANRMRWKLLLMAFAICIRILVKRERLD